MPSDIVERVECLGLARGGGVGSRPFRFWPCGERLTGAVRRLDVANAPEKPLQAFGRWRKAAPARGRRAGLYGALEGYRLSDRHQYAVFRHFALQRGRVGFRCALSSRAERVSTDGCLWRWTCLTAHGWISLALLIKCITKKVINQE